MDNILTFLTAVFLVVFILGWAWPWYFLWFVDQKTRFKILLYYGIPLLLLTGLNIVFK